MKEPWVKGKNFMADMIDDWQQFRNFALNSQLGHLDQ